MLNLKMVTVSHMFLCRPLFLLLLCLTLLDSCKKEERYDTATGEPANVAIYEGYAYAAVGENGMQIYDIVTGELLRTIPPTKKANSIDDISIDSNLLFALDARGKGYLTIYSLADPLEPDWINKPVRVPVGPYCGVEARNGTIFISGGTEKMLFLQYTSSGAISDLESELGYDRGHQGVSLSDDGKIAFVSTHFKEPVEGVEFGLRSIELDTATGALKFVSTIILPDAGFTAGVATPASFPIKSSYEDGLLAIAHGNGLSLYRVEDDSRLSLLMEIDPGIAATDVQLKDKIAYLIGHSDNAKLVKIDVGDLQNPTIDLITIPGEPTGVAVSKTHVVIAANSKGLVIMQR